MGAAETNAVIETVAIATTPKWRARRGEQASLAYAVTRLAEAPKDRSADYLIAAAESHPSLSDAREHCLRAHLEDRLRIFLDSSQPLPFRALASWLSSGVEAHNGPRVGAGNLDLLSRTLVALGANEDLVASMNLAAKRTREPIVVLVPLIWLEAQQEQSSKICNEVVPESPVLDGIPMYAFDKHTRLGLAAIQRLTRESNYLRACLEQFVPNEVWLKSSPDGGFLYRWVPCFAPAGVVSISISRSTWHRV